MKKETTKKVTKKIVPTETVELKKYKVTNEFTLEGVIIKPNQAIMLTDTIAEKHAGFIQLI